MFKNQWVTLLRRALGYDIRQHDASIRHVDRHIPHVDVYKRHVDVSAYPIKPLYINKLAVISTALNRSLTLNNHLLTH